MFTNPSQTSETPGPKDLELKKKAILREIEILGNEHFAANLAYEKIQKDLKDIELRRSKIKDNKTLLEKLEKKKSELESTLAGLENKIKDREKNLPELNKQHSKKVVALNLEISEMRKGLENELDDIKTEIGTTSKKLEPLTLKKGQLEAKKKTLTEEIKELNSKTETLKKNSVKLEEITQELLQKEKRKKELDKSIINLQSLETSLKNKIKNLPKEMATINNRIAKAKEEAEKFIKKSKGIKEKFDNEMKIQKEKVDERDGSLSKREGWLQSKTEDLRQAKRDLEKHTNREIKHIII